MKQPQIIDLADQEIVVGLSWFGLGDTSDIRSEFANLPEGEVTNFGYIADTELMAGGVVGFADKRYKQDVGVPLVIHVLSQSNPDTGGEYLFAYPVDSKRSWLMHSQQHVPSEGSDFIIDNSQIDDWIQKTNKIGVTLLAFSASIEGVSTPISQINLDNFRMHLSDVSSPFKVKQIRGVDKGLIKAASVILAVIVVVVAGVLGYGQYQHRKQMAMQVAAAAQLAEGDRQATEERKRLINEKVHAMLVDRVFSYPAAAEMVQDWFSVFEVLPETIMGWDLMQISCDFNACNATWHRQKLGTVNTFKAAAEQQQWKIISLDGDKGVISLPVKAKQRAVDDGVIVETDKFFPDFESSLQQASVAGVDFKLQQPSPIVIYREDVLPTPPPPNVAKTPQTDVVIPYRLGEFTVGGNGKGWFGARDIATYMTGSNVAFSHLIVDLERNGWSIDGSFVTR
jgi:hypothetical protein